VRSRSSVAGKAAFWSFVVLMPVAAITQQVGFLVAPLLVAFLALALIILDSEDR
jgi:hypothetical protein